MSSHRSSLTWSRLFIPTPLSTDPARAALVALAGLSGQPRIVLEVTGSRGQISWRLGAERDHLTRVLGALGAHLPGFRTEPVASTFDGLERADLAASIRFAGDRRRPLRVDAVKPVTRGLLAALSRARKADAVYVQLILGPRSRPSRARAESQDRRRPRVSQDTSSMRRKESEHSFACTVRIAATSADPARARSLINGVAGALRGLEVPGLALRIGRSSVIAFSEARSPWIWPNKLSVSDLVPLTGWPIGEPPLSGVPDTHPKLLPAHASIPERGRILGITAASQTERTVAIKNDDSLRHLHVVGPTGSGKSQVLSNLAIQSMQAGQSVVVLDPKGALVDDLLDRIPEDRQSDVVVIDPLDAAPVGINGLHGGLDADRSADALLAVFHSIYADNWGPRTHDILHASLLSLARRGDASLVMIPTLLTNPGFRRSVVGDVSRHDPMGLGAFWGWFEAISDAERTQAISPLMNKLRPILLRPGMRGVFGQRSPKFDFQDLFTKRRIVLVNLAKGRLGPEAAQLLGSIVVALVWDAARAHSASSSEHHRAGKQRQVSFIIDEVQDYLRLGDIGDALAQARSMGLAITAANQSFSQFSPAMREAFLTNARSRVAFQQSPKDAQIIAGLSRGRIEPDDLLALPAYQAYAQLLVDGSPAPWVSIRTRLMPAPSSNPAAIRELSRRQYGQPLTEVEADLLSLIDPSPQGSSGPIGRTPRASSATATDETEATS